MKFFQARAFKRRAESKTKTEQREQSWIEALEERQLLSAAVVNFSDNFSPSASSLWDNRAGSWTTSNGAYFAQDAGNNPIVTTELPFRLTDLSATVTVNNLGDGGIWVHNDGTGQNGILLVLGGNGYGQGVRGGSAGNSIYWHTIVDGVASSEENEIGGVFVASGTYTVTVSVVGDTYSAFINGSTTPATTLTSSQFPSGQIGLYDDQPNTVAGGSGLPQTFSNFTVTGTSLPASVAPSLKGAVPHSLIGGQKGQVNQVLTLTNTAGEIYAGPVTTQWFLDTGTNLDASAIALTTASTENLRLKSGAHTSLSLHLKDLPATVPASAYHLIAEVTDSSNNSSVAASVGTITVSAPLISLTAALSPIKVIRQGDTLTITNGGNIVDKSVFTATVGFSTDSAGRDPVGSTTISLKSLSIAPHKSVKVHIAVTKAMLESLTAGGSYFLTVLDADSIGDSVFAVSPLAFNA